MMKTPVLQDPCAITDVVDWGDVPTMIEGQSRTSGVLLHKGPNTGLLELSRHL